MPTPTPTPTVTDLLLFIQPSGSNKTELHRFLRSEVTSIMDEIGLSKECLVSDATSAALRKQMDKTNNTLITLADEYRSTLSSLNIGEVGRKKKNNILNQDLFPKTDCLSLA